MGKVNYLLLLVSICCCTLFTSCFDFVEEIQLTNAGAGKIKATLNLSKSSSKVASLLKLKRVNGIDIPSEQKIRSEAETMVRILKNTAGISQVQYHLDFKNYIATVSCDFTNINALNAFSKTLASHFKSSLGNANSYQYASKTGVFSRSFTQPTSLNKFYKGISDADKQYFTDAYYTQIIRFAKPVKSQQHTSAKISSNGTAVLLKVKATDLISGKNTLANTIILSNN